MVLVVGGQSRKVGKTSVVAGIIRALVWAEWTAVKITHHHAHSGWALERESSASGDSGRYLAAGARESWCLRSSPACLAQAMPGLRDVLSASRNSVIESNSLLDHLTPDLYLLVLDPASSDIKESALRHYARADAYIVVENDVSDARQMISHRPCFPVTRPAFVSQALTQFIAARLAQATGSETSSVRSFSPE